MLEIFHLEPVEYLPLKNYLIRFGFPMYNDKTLASSLRILQNKKVIKFRDGLEAKLIEWDFNKALEKYNSGGGAKIYGGWARELQNLKVPVEVELHNIYFFGFERMYKFAGAFYNENLNASYFPKDRKIRVESKIF